ncbi:hypothetical protein D3C76_1448710 [compost metagenome]
MVIEDLLQHIASDVGELQRQPICICEAEASLQFLLVGATYEPARLTWPVQQEAVRRVLIL